MTTAASVDLSKARPGATRLADGVWQFVLWAPRLIHPKLRLLGSTQHLIEMEAGERGYFSAVVENVPAATRYFYQLEDGRELPDPASRFQPEGVHGPSQIVDTAMFQWSDAQWQPPALAESVFYELHVGTFTREGTFEAAIERLGYLRDLGITTIEIMPVAQFPGDRNWGYDGAYPYAAQNTYGGPDGLQRLVDAAHKRGLAVALDVVYNHLGPEGNYLGAYAEYFTDRYRTPWGDALNYDGPGSDEVRRYFIENALYWIREFHIDALRLDAIHGIFDFSARPFLAELKEAVGELRRSVGRQVYLIAESDLNDRKIISSRERGGYGIDAQWSDDFHHSVHTLLTGERQGYYQDFGTVWHLAETLRQGWCYTGQYSRFRKRSYGNSPAGISRDHFVVCNQNHDQVGNRTGGERLSQLVDFESLKLAAGITLLSPFVPLLFMGEEYAEQHPFQYFTSHLDPTLVEAVRTGRRNEFAAFGWEDVVPDPQSQSTFDRSKLNHEEKEAEPHATMLRLYRELIQLRKKYELGRSADWQVWKNENSCFGLFRPTGNESLLLLFNFSAKIEKVDVTPWPGHWQPRLVSGDQKWGGPGEAKAGVSALSKPFLLELHPHSFVALEDSGSDAERE